MATPTTANVTLTWTASSDDVGVTEYDIYRDGSYYGFTKGETTFIDTSVPPVLSIVIRCLR